jgi:hypothetical protein
MSKRGEVKNCCHHKRGGNRWDKLDGGVREVFVHVNIAEINAACERFLAEREPNFVANKARVRNLLGGKFRAEKGGAA